MLSTIPKKVRFCADDKLRNGQDLKTPIDELAFSFPLEQNISWFMLVIENTEEKEEVEIDFYFDFEKAYSDC